MMTSTLTTTRIGKWGLEVDTPDKDPRGQLLVWEPPQATCDYCIGVDPTMGILGWNRQMRSDEEEKHDNAALEVFRVGALREVEEERDGKKTRVLKKQPDVQVAEWVGPLDAQDLAYVANFLGRMYAGASEEQQALMAIEIYPGPGWLTQRVLHDQYGYERFPAWLVEGQHMIQRDTGRRGWISNASTRRDLWIRGAGHIKRFNAILNSPWLVEEMADCTPDNFLSVTARAGREGKTGLNDDRVVAALIALWFCNEWVVGAEPTEPTGPVQDASAKDWQLSAMSAEEMQEEWDARVSELLGG